MGKRLNPYSVKSRHWLALTFAAALCMALLLFVPFIVFNNGIFFYFGDFNVQEIPFYQLIHGQVRDGTLGWNHLTDLGTDTLASYSFYLMGSPFFWLTIPFPNEFVPYLIGPILILKFACTASSAYLWLQRHVRFKGYAAVGGILYAFSGFSLYNVFFFHFHEPMMMFPLLLAALDCFLYDRRRGIFAVAVCAACVVNYYFFVGQALFVIMYFIVLACTKTWKFKITEFLLLALEVLIGFAGAMFMLLPSVLGLLGNPRLDSYPKGWNALVYDRPQRYWLMLLAFFFPADIPALPTFTPESNCKWASVAGWLPFFGMTGVIAYLQLHRKSWLKKMILLLILFAAVPALNSMFQLLNISIFYTRWFYMLVLMMVLATLRSVEDTRADWNRAFVWSAGITAGFSLLIGVMPDLTEEKDKEIFRLGVEADRIRFWIYAIFALVGLLCFILLYRKFGNTKRRWFVAMTAGVFAVAMGASYFSVGTGVLESGTTQTIQRYIINQRDKIEIDDLEDVRSDFYKDVDNTAMYWKVQSINCFQSSVSPSIMQFYKEIGITRDVASRPDFSAYGIRPLLSTKYYFDYNHDNLDHSKDESFVDIDGNTKMPCWKFLKECNGFDIYENECYIPMGFVFDNYVTEEEFDRVADQNRPQALLYGMVLTREQMAKYSDITGYTEKRYSALYGTEPKLFKSSVESYAFGEQPYREACEKLAQDCCDSFRYTDDGFCAEYENFGSDKLMFFSIPYSEGFTAEVNGEPVDIEKVDFGLMAVRVPGKSKCDIVFHYETPGFRLGLQVSACAGIVLAVYLTAVLIIWIIRRKRNAIRKNSRI